MPSLRTLPPSEPRYQVVWWIDSEGENKQISGQVTGSPNPGWVNSCSWEVGLKSSLGEDHFVNVDVLRYNSNENHCDPGTSDGIGEVFRARVPFPKTLEETIQRSYELVKHDGTGNLKPAGDIALSMGLETWKKDYNRWDRFHEIS